MLSPDGFITPPPDRAIRLDNATCVYCRRYLTADLITKEHVIGRRFVPRGKLNGHWNLIVRACRPCNVLKSDLEDDISAITLLPDLDGRYAHDDEGVKNEARRKAERAFSRKTKRLVKDSAEQFKVNMPIASGVNLSCSFTAPPQIDESRAFKLARLQLAAFFYWISFNQATKKGHAWVGDYCTLLMANRRDWGNPVLREFANIIENWDTRVFANSAECFFRLMIKKHPDAACWAWAIEWNQATRLTGFFGDKDTASEIASKLPWPPMQTVHLAPNHFIRYRFETPLDDADDNLFVVDLSDEEAARLGFVS